MCATATESGEKKEIGRTIDLLRRKVYAGFMIIASEKEAVAARAKIVGFVTIMCPLSIGNFYFLAYVNLLEVGILSARAPYSSGLRKFVDCACSVLEKDRKYSFNQVGEECGMDRRTIRDYLKIYSNEVKIEMQKECGPKKVMLTDICEEGLIVDPPSESNNLLPDFLVCVTGIAIITSPIWLPTLINRISER